MWRDRMDYSTIIPLKRGLKKQRATKSTAAALFNYAGLSAAPHKFFGGGVYHFKLAAASGFGGCMWVCRTWQSCSGHWSHFKILDTLDIGMQRTFTLIVWVYWNVIVYIIVTFWIFEKSCVCFMIIQNCFCNFTLLILWNRLKQCCYVVIIAFFIHMK